MADIQLGFEDKLWQMADKLRGNIESSEYKHVILGLVFLKYISDSFTERYEEIKAKYPGMEEDRDAYEAENVFFVPKEARWDYIKSQAKQPTIGQIIDNAMVLIERENANTLKGVLPKNYARPELDKTRLGELIDLFSFNVGSKEARAKDVLGRVYEYFLKKFGTTEGEFYTPPSIVKLLVNMIEPYSGRVYDPCCGSGGMFVQSARFVEEHQGTIGDISIYGQESISTTWRLAKMNLAIRGIDANLGERDADTFTNDQHKTLRADFILANPPFNIKDWGQQHLTDDRRWQWGTPSSGNANYAWISHIITKLSPRGIAGFLLSSGSTTSELEIRSRIVEEDLVKAIIMLPPKLFYSTPISPVIWIISKSQKHNWGKILFLDLSKKGSRNPEDKKNAYIKDDTITEVSGIVHTHLNFGHNIDISDFAITKTLREVKDSEYNLTPQRHINYTSKDSLSTRTIFDLKNEILIQTEEIKENIFLLSELLEGLDEIDF